MHFLRRFSIVLAVFAGQLVWAQDYLVRPSPADLSVDAGTTFLVDLSSAKSKADYASGDAALGVTSSGFVSGGGYKGSLTFMSAGNFPTNAWTLELILRVPYQPTPIGDLQLCGWNNTSPQFTFSLLLTEAFGPRARFYSANPLDGIYAQPYAGGSRRSIQASAPDKWVYVTYGCDFAGQKAMVAARELNGDILNRDINFASTPWLDTNFLSGIPVDQQATELAKRWLSSGTNFSKGMPSTISLGNANVEIRAIRISRIFRDGIFEFAPDLPVSSPTNVLPANIDAARTLSRSVSRTVGYPGFGNYKTMVLDEPYLPLGPGDLVVSLQLPNLPVGLYSCYVYGQVDPLGRNSLDRVWKPCPMEFRAVDEGGTLLAQGTMLLKQSLQPHRLQGFHFHLDSQTTNVTVTFGLTSDAQETAWLQKITIVDQLAGFPKTAIKQSQNLATGAADQLPSLTDARKSRDDLIWNALPPLNTPLQANAQVAEFSAPPSGVSLHNWATKSLLNLRDYQEPSATFSPLDFVDLDDGTLFPQAKILSSEKWPGPYGEGPNGVFFSKTDFPSLATSIYNTKRAELLGHRYLLYAGALMNSRGSLYGLDLPLAYFNGGGPEVGHDAAMALVRWAYDWPALEMSLHEIRLSTHSPDFESGIDWSDNPIRNGKLEYYGWSGNHASWLFEAYDQVFPYIKNNQVFADAVHRFIPWVHSPEDVIQFLDSYLIFSSIRDTKTGLIDPAIDLEDEAGIVLGPGPSTSSFFDLTKQYSQIYPAPPGTYQEMYATALSRSGVDYIGSFEVYALGTARDLLKKAERIKQAKESGVTVPMDLSDVDRYPKVRSAGSFLLDMWVAGGFPFMAGDASGGTHYPRDAASRLTVAGDAIRAAFELYQDPRHAWVLQHLLGENDPAVLAAASGVADPVLNATSHVVPDFGAILEMTPAETDVRKKTAATLRLGIGSGHAHNDYLDLNFFGMGLPLAVDLACRNEQNNWSRPAAGWSFLHNHALAHDDDDPNGAGVQTGEPWLTAFAPPLVRASYTDRAGGVHLDRDVILMQVGESEQYYAFDVQRLRGGTYHTWAFHGCESENLDLNVPMQDGSTRWIDRTLEGTRKIGTATDDLQAVWTMTRTESSFAYSFNGGGTLKTVPCEPYVLGGLYDAGLPPVKVRATLLGRGNDTVLQGNPYSAPYSYCFPFLWVQCNNESESVYPAVYEWYRGGTPTVTSASIIESDPLTVRVITSTGQVDTYESTPGYFLAVSRDAAGVRWAKLSGSHEIKMADLVLKPDPDYQVTISDIDYAGRRLTTSSPLPDNPKVAVGNAGRRIVLQLHGGGTSFTWDDDLLVQEGEISTFHVSGPNTIILNSTQPLLLDGGNRHAEAMTVTSEDYQWQFRGGTLVKGPVNELLTTDAFKDANGDGFVNMKTYEIGVGDQVGLPVEITVERNASGWLIRSNVALDGTIGKSTFKMDATTGSLSVKPNTPPAAPKNLRRI